MSILNLTRPNIPPLTKSIIETRKNIMKMPEMVLHKMKFDNPEGVIYVGMNECKTAQILPDEVNTIFTDGLASCNSVALISRNKDGYPIVMLSHYGPSEFSQVEQVKTIEKQLKTYGAYFDKKYKAKVFYNVPGYMSEEGLKPCVNNLFSKIRTVFDKFFKHNYEEQIIPYQRQNRPAGFSTANIFQFDTKNPNQCKMTNVGEHEIFFDI